MTLFPRSKRSREFGRCKIKEVEGIREVFGQYDIIARIEARNLKAMRSLIITKVRSIPGVIATTTLITST